MLHELFPQRLKNVSIVFLHAPGKPTDTSSLRLFAGVLRVSTKLFSILYFAVPHSETFFDVQIAGYSQWPWIVWAVERGTALNCCCAPGDLTSAISKKTLMVSALRHEPRQMKRKSSPYLTRTPLFVVEPYLALREGLWWPWQGERRSKNRRYGPILQCALILAHNVQYASPHAGHANSSWATARGIFSH